MVVHELPRIIKQVEHLMILAKEPDSLDRIVGTSEGDGVPLVDLIPANDGSYIVEGAYRDSLNNALYRHIERLTEPQKRIIVGVYFLGATLEELAASEGIKKSKVKSEHNAALRKMRHYMQRDSKFSEYNV